MLTRPKLIGVLPPLMRVSNLNVSTHQFNIDRVLE
jgi:hypothetical protein